MRLLSKLLFAVKSLFSRQKRDEQLSEEIRTHMEMATEANVAAGMTPDEARFAALREFGNVASIQQRTSESRDWVWLEQAAQGIAFAGRRLRRSPAFSVTVIAILGISLGGNLTIFAWIDAVLLRPLPFPESDRLTLIFNTYPKAGVLRDGSSITNYYERRGQLPAFSGLALFRPSAAMVGEPRSMQREAAIRVSPDFFDVLGRGPIRGRSFTEAEAGSFQASRVVIISDAFWRLHFGSDPAVIGRPLLVNGAPHSVVGVLPPDYHFLSFEAHLYFPLVSEPADRTPARRHSGGNVTQMIGRLNPGIDPPAAQIQVDAHNASMERNGPEAEQMRAAGFRSLVVSLHDDHVAGMRPTLWLMQAGGCLLLVIASANLVNLFSLRATERRKELAIRQALGASRRNVITEVVAEIVWLSLAGGAVGVAAAAAAVRLSAILGTSRLPLGAQVVLDGRLALLAVGGAVVLGLIFGWVVALLVLRDDPRQALQAMGHGVTASRALRRWRHIFSVTQIALALVLVAAASQLLLSFTKSLAVPPGFQTQGVLTEKIWISPASAPNQAGFVTVSERIVDQVARQPGVAAVGLVTNLPFGGLTGKGAVTVRDWTLPAGESPRGHYLYTVAGDYFAAMRLDLVQGRFLTMADSRRPERVCVIDEDFARYYWPDRSPLGQVVFDGSKAGKEGEGYTVVGVVARVKHANLTDPEAPGAVYFPLGHRPDRDVYIVVRTSQPGIAGETLHTLIKGIEPTLSLSELRLMQDRLDESLVSRRSPAILSGLFAAVALLLAVVGIYGLLSYAVTQQYREIGIRMALGAGPGKIFRQFMAHGGQLLLWGTILGSTGIWSANRALQPLLFGIPSFPAGLWTGAITAVAGFTLLASYVPARRATRIDPMVALRTE